FFMPSSHAARITAWDRYGFTAASGSLYSRRPTADNRTVQVLLSRPQLIRDGANCPASQYRLYEFTVDPLISMAPAECASSPPSACRPTSDRCSSVTPGSARTLTSSRHRLKLWWHPLPIMPVAGLGMNLRTLGQNRQWPTKTPPTSAPPRLRRGCGA